MQKYYLSIVKIRGTDIYCNSNIIFKTTYFKLYYIQI